MSLRLPDGACSMKAVNKGAEMADEQALRTSLLRQTFYPLTLPLTTGPGRRCWRDANGFSQAVCSKRQHHVLQSRRQCAVLSNVYETRTGRPAMIDAAPDPGNRDRVQ